jgi:hypothetical protein
MQHFMLRSLRRSVKRGARGTRRSLVRLGRRGSQGQMQSRAFGVVREVLEAGDREAPTTCTVLVLLYR